MKHRKETPASGAPRIRPAEQILIEALGRFPAGRILCTSLGRGQLAAEAARLQPSAAVCCSFLDLYPYEQSVRLHGDALPNLRFECQADFPQGPFDAFAMPTVAGGDGELVRELLRAGHLHLRVGGTMFVATDNPKDTWLHEEMKKLFPKVTREPSDEGTLYIATKTAPPRKIKSYACRFAFRDEGRLIHAVSRPGVFSHRRIDGGARALLRAAVLTGGERVLELGCGSGVVSFALALRAPQVRVRAIDSNTRAVECTRMGAELNGLANVAVDPTTAEALLEEETVAGAFDLVVANPPYFSNDRIAEIFGRCAARALTPEGSALFVTKRTEWYEERFPELFSSVAIEPAGNYLIVRCRGARPR